MSDIVERLKAHARKPYNATVDGPLCSDAAAEIERLREALKPFAMAADAIDAFDPTFPDDGAALRASFDVYTTEGNANVRARHFRAARSALKGGTE